MRLHGLWLLSINDGEEYEIYDSEEAAKDRMVSIARQSREENDEELSEMEEQLLRTHDSFMEGNPDVEIIYVS